MLKNKLTTCTKIFLTPTLIIAGLIGCGYQDGAQMDYYNTNQNEPNTFGMDTYRYDNKTNMFGSNYDNNYGTWRPNPYDTEYGAAFPRADGYNTAAHDNATYRIHSAMVSNVENEAKKVAGVSQASATIKGNDIMIAITVSNNAHDSNGIKNKVQQAIKSIEPTYRIHVTIDNGNNTQRNNNGTIIQQIGENSMNPIG